MDMDTQSNRNRYQTLLILGLFLFISVVLFYAAQRQARALHETYPHYMMKVDAVLFDVSESHLWFEEILSGDRHEAIEEVFAIQLKALKQLKGLNGLSDEETFSGFQEQIQKAYQALDAFESVTHERYSHSETSQAGTPIDQQYDAHYKVFRDAMKNIHLGLSTRFDQESKELESIHYTFLALFMASFGVMGVVLVRLEKRRDNALKALRALNEHLEARVERGLQERIAQEQVLIKKSRFVVMGEMLSAITHQWRQPLNLLGLHIQEIKEEHEFDQLSAESLERLTKESMEQIHYLSDTIDDFRNFFSPNKKRITFSVEQALKEALNLVTAQLNHYDITCRVHIVSTDWSLEGYPNEFKQAVINLVHNAKDAIVEYRKTDAIEGLIEIEVDGIGRRVQFSDNGGGISNETLARIFDPYFTTKSEDKGTGIGLYMTQMIIEKNMGGSITVNNCVKGACFTLCF